MADTEGVKDTKHYFTEVPASHEGFHLKGAHQLDWGMRNRLSKVFRPSTGRTVMLAIDHGYFLGPTTGLERIDLTIVPLLQYADALMCTRGILRSSIPSTFSNGVVMRSSGGPSTLKELSNELIAVDIDDAVRMNVSAMAVQVVSGRSTCETTSRPSPLCWAQAPRT
jgi:putative autoinducer-2 (AI-2) aldolase